MGEAKNIYFTCLKQTNELSTTNPHQNVLAASTLAVNNYEQKTISFTSYQSDPIPSKNPNQELQDLLHIETTLSTPCPATLRLTNALPSAKGCASCWTTGSSCSSTPNASSTGKSPSTPASSSASSLSSSSSFGTWSPPSSLSSPWWRSLSRWRITCCRSSCRVCCRWTRGARRSSGATTPFVTPSSAPSMSRGRSFFRAQEMKA